MPASVLQTNPAAFYQRHHAATMAALERVLDSGWYILGAEVQAFESEFAQVHGVAHGVGVANGTDAIALALRALGVQPGDHVATVSMTAVATVAAIQAAGAIPVLLDICPQRCTLSAGGLAAALPLLPPIKALVVVHLYGQMADMPAIMQLAREHGIAVVEDCAQAHGASLDGRMAGSFADCAAFSFYPTKNLGCLGDGGMVLTPRSDIAARLRSLREYGWQERYVSAVAGTNSRLDEMQAALLRLRLPYLQQDNQRRQALAARYGQGLRGIAALQLPQAFAGTQHVFHQYVVRHAQRDALRTHLRQQGIQTNVHYPLAVHQQPAYAATLRAPGGLRASEALAQQALSLPMYAELDDAAAERVIAAMHTFCDGVTP